MEKFNNKSQKQLDLEKVEFWKKALIDDALFTLENELDIKVLKVIYPDAYRRYKKIKTWYDNE